eukprot:gene682-1137_t
MPKQETATAKRVDRVADVRRDKPKDTNGRLAPTTPSAPRFDAGEQLERARKLCEEQLWPEVVSQRAATDLLEKLLIELPDHPHPPFFLATSYHNMGRSADSIPFYEKALQLNPTLIHARLNLIKALCGTGRLREAVPHAAAACEHEPQSAARRFELGVLHTQLGDSMAASQSYIKAIKMDACFKEAYINNDAALLQLGSTKKVLRTATDCQACEKYAKLAVEQTERGAMQFWTHPLQRPPQHVPGLRSRPWHDPEDFPWMKRLEAAFPEIRQELLQVMASDVAGQSWGKVGERSTHDASLSPNECEAHTLSNDEVDIPVSVRWPSAEGSTTNMDYTKASVVARWCDSEGIRGCAMV